MGETSNIKEVKNMSEYLTLPGHKREYLVLIVGIPTKSEDEPVRWLFPIVPLRYNSTIMSVGPELADKIVAECVKYHARTMTFLWMKKGFPEALEVVGKLRPAGRTAELAGIFAENMDITITFEPISTGNEPYKLMEFSVQVNGLHMPGV